MEAVGHRDRERIDPRVLHPALGGEEQQRLPALLLGAGGEPDAYPDGGNDQEDDKGDHQPEYDECGFLRKGAFSSTSSQVSTREARPWGCDPGTPWPSPGEAGEPWASASGRRRAVAAHSPRTPGTRISSSEATPSCRHPRTGRH